MHQGCRCQKNRNEYAKALDINQGILIDFQIHGKLQPICQFRLATFLHSHPPGCDHIQTRHLQMSTHFFSGGKSRVPVLIILLPRWLLVQLGVFLVLQHGLNTRWPFLGESFRPGAPHSHAPPWACSCRWATLASLGLKSKKKCGFLLLKIHPPKKKFVQKQHTCKMFVVNV